MEFNSYFYAKDDNFNRNNNSNNSNNNYITVFCRLNL